MSVLALKEKIKESTAIPEERQRLIYRGRVLQDDSAVNDYQIAGGRVPTYFLLSSSFNKTIKAMLFIWLLAQKTFASCRPEHRSPQ
jgi:hypothetical protein